MFGQGEGGPLFFIFSFSDRLEALNQFPVFSFQMDGWMDPMGDNSKSNSNSYSDTVLVSGYESGEA